MKYALLIYSAPGARPADSGPAGGPESMADWLGYTGAVRASGGLLAAEQLKPTDTATTLRLRGGERLLTDGPFAETKEHLLGFYLLDVPDLDTALDWAARMPLIGWATVEVRPVVEGAAWQAALE
ncbi:MAG TPA: YciI family protein [Rugosimonospora sp.]|nr:YciI family protein [Rugosimonospora sp.]